MPLWRAGLARYRIGRLVLVVLMVGVPFPDRRPPRPVPPDQS